MLVCKLQDTLTLLTTQMEAHNASKNTQRLDHDIETAPRAKWLRSYAEAADQPAEASIKMTGPMTMSEIEQCHFAPRRRAEYSFVYIQGVRRMSVAQVKRLCTALGIGGQAVRNISFIGAQTLELVVFADQADTIAAAFETGGFKHDTMLHPHDPALLSGPNFAQLTEEEKASTARTYAAKRLERILARIPATRRFSNLRSFLTLTLGSQNDTTA
jgi:hypothetical protein